MLGPCDVEDQPVGGIERDERRVAIAPQGEAVEPGVVGDRIVLDRDQLWKLRAGIGQRHADAESGRLRVCVDARDAQRAALLLGKGQRGVGRRGAVRQSRSAGRYGKNSAR